MAIKRLNPKQTFEVISITDSALLPEEPDFEVDANGAPVMLDGEPVKKSTRYERYTENANFDESQLRYVDGHKPDRFILRPLTNDEKAELNSKYTFIDTVKKRIVFTNQSKLLLESFLKSYQGIKSSDGKVERLSVDEIPYDIAIEMGAIVQLISALGKNEKKS